MKNFADLLLEKKPDCISKFNTSRVDRHLSYKMAENFSSAIHSINCFCGNANLYLKAAQHKQLKGVCSKSEVIAFKPPVYVNCLDCSQTTLLFDPEIHGWQAEQNLWPVTENALILVKCIPQPVRVYVNYTYHNTEGYKVLLDQGVANIEDYFDSFTVFYSRSPDDELIEIISCQCGLC